MAKRAKTVMVEKHLINGKHAEQNRPSPIKENNCNNFYKLAKLKISSVF